MTEKIVNIDLPIDDGGFLPRQCPNCDDQFTVHGDTYEQECYLNLRCPYCNWIDEFDEFLTDEQAEYAEVVAETEARMMLEDEFKEMWDDAFSGISNDYIEVETNTDEIDFGERSAPSPQLSLETQEITCSDCGFRYAVDKREDEGKIDCPVCR